MPHTINGIGTGYWGRKNLVAIDATCEFCEAYTTLRSYDTMNCFVVLFLPLLPLGKKRIIDYCSSCTGHRALPLKKYEQAKADGVRQASEAFRANPRDMEAITEFLATIAAYRDESLFHQAAVQLKQFSYNNGPLLELLGDGYDMFGNDDEAERCYKACLSIQDNDQVRVKLAACLVGSGKSLEALPLVNFILNQKLYDQANLLVYLVQGLQAEGNHHEALELLARMEEALPELVEDPNLIKLRKNSLKHRQTGKKVLAKGWKKQSTKARESGGMLLPFLVPIAVVLLYLGLCFSMGFQRSVFVVSGVDQPYEVQIGRERITLQPKAHTSVQVREGLIPIVYYNRQGQEQKLICEVRTPFLMRPFIEKTFVINPDQSAIILWELMEYGAADLEESRYDQRYESGQPLYIYDEIEYRFKEFPESIMANASSSRLYRERISILPYKKIRELRLLVDETNAPAITEALKGRLQFDEADEMALGLYRVLSPAPEALQFISPKLDKRPVLVSWHRAYQNLSEHGPELVEKYRRYHEANPEDGEWLYLYAVLLEDDAQQRLDLLHRSASANPPSADGMNSVAYQYLANGQFETALSWNEKARALAPGNEKFQHLYDNILESLGRYDELIKKNTEALKETPLDHYSQAQIIRFKVASGDETPLASSIEPFLEVQKTKNAETDKGLRNWRRYFRSVQAYALGDLEQLNESARDTPFLMVERQLAEAPPEDMLKEEEPDLALAIAILSRARGLNELNRKALTQACDLLAQGKFDERLIAACLRGEQPERILTAGFPPERKRLALVAVGQQHPQLRESCFALAKRLNYNREFPYLTVKRVLEGTY